MKLINDEEAKRLNESKNASTLESLLSTMKAGEQTAATRDQITLPENFKAGIRSDNNQAMLEDMITKPLTPEDVEKRKRTATAVGAVGSLGNLISAYANLAGTTKGNAPMTIPGYQGPDIDSWQDKAIKRQQEYAAMMSGLNAQDWEQQYKMQQLEESRAQRKEAQERWQQEFDEGKRQFDTKQAQAEKELESLDKYRAGQVKANQTRADNSGSGRSGGSGTPNNDTISAGDYEYKFNRREGNFTTWNGIYQMIPEDWVAMQPAIDKIGWGDSNSTILTKMQNLINAYAEQNPDWMERVMNKYPSVITRTEIERGGENAFDLNDNNVFDLTK